MGQDITICCAQSVNDRLHVLALADGVHLAMQWNYRYTHESVGFFIPREIVGTFCEVLAGRRDIFTYGTKDRNIMLANMKPSNQCFDFSGLSPVGPKHYIYLSDASVARLLFILEGFPASEVGRPVFGLA